MPGIIGLIGVIPVIMLRLGSKPGTQIESVSIEHKILAYKSSNYLFKFYCTDSFTLSLFSLFASTSITVRIRRMGKKKRKKKGREIGRREGEGERKGKEEGEGHEEEGAAFSVKKINYT